MHFLQILASLGLLSASIVSASPVELEDRAASSEFHLRVQNQEKAPHPIDGQFLTPIQAGTTDDLILVPDMGGKKNSPQHSNFTLSKGSLHLVFPPNMVIPGGVYSSPAPPYNKFVKFEKGNFGETNDPFVFNKHGYLDFQKHVTDGPRDFSFRLCPYKKTNFRALYLSFSRQSDPKGCIPVFVEKAKA